MVEFLELTNIEANVGLPRPYTSIGFLGGPVGEHVDRWIKDRYEESMRGVGYNMETDLVEGSKPAYVSLANIPLKRFGLRTATQAELEYAKMLNDFDKKYGLDFMSKYEDSSLILRNLGGRNASLAKELAAQANFQGKPIVIPLHMTNVEVDGKELTFGLKKYAEVIETDILNHTDYFKSGDIDLQTGIPLRMNEWGNRYMYGSKTGLSRLYLGTGHCLVANEENMLGSSPNGRVVVVRPSPNFS
ncbi:MAG: hypothetical protein V1678_01765 [Candidatus Aenigmatarchaeota archaeon]